MSELNLTDNELLVLGLVAEVPRHGYELERVIERRAMREWTQIGFSSIYFVLGKLEKKKLVKPEEPTSAKAKKRYRLTKIGRTTLVNQTLDALEDVRPTYSALLMGMLHWPVPTRNQALNALRKRKKAVEKEIERLKEIHIEQQPMPNYVDVMFDFSIGQLKAEATWIEITLDRLGTKPGRTN